MWNNLLTFLILAIANLAAATSAVAQSTERVRQDLLALYTFEGSTKDVIPDQSGNGEPLNLRLEQSPGITVRRGRLIVTSSARISSVEPARKIAAAVKRANALSIEAWIKPADARQAGPARIVTLSADPGQRNFTLGQEAGRFDVRLRTTATDGNGIPSTASSEASVRTELTHVVFARDPNGAARIYLNGKEAAHQPVAGQLSNWSDDFRLSLVNEFTGDRPWLGEIALVAIYARALSAEEVARNFAAGAPAAMNYAALLPPASTRPIDFVKDVQPLLRKHCFECHAAENEEGGLNLGVRQRAMEGGDHGPVLVKGDSATSRLIHLVAAVDPKEVMPPGEKRLSKEDVGLLRAWIDQGAGWPDGADVVDPRMERAKAHWAFQPLRENSLPEVSRIDWSRTPVDRLILARLEQAGLSPAPAAGREQLIRRAHFDLIGLPPPPEEVEAFCAVAETDRQQAFEALIDRLLASRHHGERWGRHWLDLAHYADSDGWETDTDRPNAYHYRDFVIQAFNDDMPFDQFVRWQLAGDEYESNNPQAVAATGFLVAGPHQFLDPAMLSEQEVLQQRYVELDDVLSTVGGTFLGLTIGCARCHDHKYDAIPARDYYRILSAFHSGDRAEAAIGKGQKALVYRDDGPTPKPTWLFKRADFHDRRQSVQLGFVSALTRGKSPDDYWNEARQASPRQDSTLQRRAFAEWMTDPEHGAGALLARVIVNRLWQHHFGAPLVRSVNDFGVRAEPPTHPDLLEWLANDLATNGWRLKRLHRLMLASAAYQQASAGVIAPPADPENRLLWKMRPQRLEAEILRDAMLAASGTLNREPFGPAFKPNIPAEVMAGSNGKDPWPKQVADSPAVRRRSVYLFHKRLLPYPLLQAFDKPDAQQSCGRRDETTVAPQALALLNDPFIRSISVDFADRLLKEAGAEPAAWIDRSFRLALSRPPSDGEREASLEFVNEQIEARTKRAEQDARRKALADWCQALFSLNEFIYID